MISDKADFKLWNNEHNLKARDLNLKEIPFQNQ